MQKVAAGLSRHVPAVSPPALPSAVPSYAEALRRVIDDALGRGDVERARAVLDKLARVAALRSGAG